jgi:glycosyltransferase involved in cell wall biosynthesis
MNGDAPLLSIVIPTRNRFDYVRSAIESVLRISSSQLQLAVKDNSDTNRLELWLRNNVSDQRLTYHYSNAQASMSENYDRAMSLASGEYVCLIGDDDGVNPEIIAATRWAKENTLDALVPTSLINYVWPDLHMTTYGAMEAGEVRIRPFTGAVTYPDGEVEMRKCAKDAGQNFHKLPKAYYGIVRKDCLDQVKAKTGTYFPGISPDMAAALAVANYAKRICHVDYPLFVPGSSAKSNAGLSGMKKHIGWLRDQPHLPATCEKDWSNIVPAFYSVQTIWAEATVNSLQATGRTDILKDFNVPRLFAFCSINYSGYMSTAGYSFYHALRATQRGILVGTLQFAYWFFYLWGSRAKSLVARLIGGSHDTDSYCAKGLQNIDEAVQAVSAHLAKTGLRFNMIIARV